ncbi:restriction endonuclease subunit S [Pseudoalteromonas sp. SWYJ118]|uniref:restriction endonuclease subunit S n=1 Tax=Pseudoalteromonas sp. SWYJ118 TaxID=2792062 RepID=UPI0018CE26D8|nr:restriction endonuclease subunit S [Pseudoalteromonas sp. SWYJ118]MBH0076023.1 restriction endonuclease subunit S [Pseudoalteromonas sp. SWYJ118]
MTKNNQDILPILRFPEFEGSWVEKSLSDFLTFKNGINAGKEAYGTGYKFINVLDIINNDFITHDDIIGSVNVSLDVFNKNIVEYGDILFQRSSETRDEVGQANVYLDKNKSATFGGFVIRGKAKEEYDPLFMNALLKTTNARKEITAKSGGSTRFNVGQGTLSSVRIFTTNINEQIKISAFLSTVDKRIKLLQTKKEELIKNKKGLMKKLFSQTIRFKDKNGNCFPIWRNKTLKEVSEIKMGQSPSSKSYNLEQIGLPLIQGNADIVNRLSRPRQWTDRPTKTCDIADILLTVRAPVGAVAKSIHKACIGRGICSITNNAFSDLEFLYQFLIWFEPKWGSLEQGSTFSAVSGQDIRNLNILIPDSLIEQKKIADFLKLIDKSIENISQQIDSSLTFKQGLLRNMFV